MQGVEKSFVILFCLKNPNVNLNLRDLFKKKGLSGSWSSNPDVSTSLDAWTDTAYQCHMSEQRHQDVLHRLDTMAVKTQENLCQLQHMSRLIENLNTKLENVEKELKLKNSGNKQQSDSSDEESSDENSKESRAY